MIINLTTDQYKILKESLNHLYEVDLDYVEFTEDEIETTKKMYYKFHAFNENTDNTLNLTE